VIYPGQHEYALDAKVTVWPLRGLGTLARQLAPRSRRHRRWHTSISHGAPRGSGAQMSGRSRPPKRSAPANRCASHCPPPN